MQEHDSFKNTIICEGVQSGVVGNPFANVLHDNGHVEVCYCNENAKHNVIHPVILKFFDEVVNNEDSLFYNCPWFMRRNSVLSTSKLSKYGTMV